MNKLSVVLVGLGNVGQGYDYDYSSDSVILTHATAIDYHPKFELIAGVDINSDQCKRFKEKFSKPAYLNMDELSLKRNPDVVSIALPTAMHSNFFHEALSFYPKAIVLEKPVADSVFKAEKMLQVAKSSRCTLCVNYLRRFNPALNELKKLIHEGKFGKIYKGTIWYTKGIIENGSHFVDLFQWLLGEAQEVQVMNPGRKWDGHDPEPDLQINFGAAKIYMFSGCEEKFCMGSFDLVGTNGTVHYEDSKALKIRFAQDDPVYIGYKELGDEEKIENHGERNIWFTYDNLAEHFRKGVPLNSTLETGTSTLKVIEKIILQLGKI